MTPEKISIIIPVLNDADALRALLPALQAQREAGHEVLVVDGGSADGSMTVARALADRVLMTGTGRARQMNLGADNASHEILLFLHADSLLPADGPGRIQDALADAGRHWGRFNVSFDQRGPVFATIAALMNWRSRLSGVATGDQGIFVRKSAFYRVGGYESIALMEDIALSKALRKLSWPACLPVRVRTSARRWQREGVLRTILLMWFLRLAYFAGADTDTLARWYYRPAEDSRD